MKAAVLHIKDNDNIEIVGVYEHKTHGFQNGAVSNLGEFSECVYQTIQPLLDKTGIKLKEIHLGLGGELVEARQTSTVIPLIDKGTKVISSRDIKYVNEQARLLSIKMDEEVLHDLPQQYLVDDVNSALNPKGLYGRKLGVTSMMIMCNVTRLRNITKGINQAGFDVGRTYFNPLAASDVTLTNEDLAEGCILLDVGSELTSVLIFKDRVLKYFDKILCGGDTFTKAIATELGLSFDLAQEVKVSYADALESQSLLDEEILLKKDDGYTPIKREVILQAIKPHIDQLVNDVEMSIRKSGLSETLNRGIVVLGGGALLPGLIEKIGDVSSFSVRLGGLNMETNKRLRNAASFAPVIGLAQRGFKETFAYSLTNIEDGTWMKRISNKVKDFYQEYF